jgi:tRNA(Ile)-lysidine synthase
MNSSQWGSFEHAIWKNLKDSGLNEVQSFILAVSGGLDSMVLLHLMHKLKPQARFKVVHFHHGPTDDSALLNYRDQCLKLIEKETELLKQSHNTILISSVSKALLQSEDDCRKARWSFFDSLADEGEMIVTAHHLDDRLETIMLKLLRGSSLDGVSSFKMWNGKVFRPFLNISKNELYEYAQNNNIKWLDDPSNSESEFLRNWLRNEWLVQLDKKLEGGRLNLAKSLIKIADQAIDNDDFSSKFQENCISNQLNRNWYFTLSRNDQLRCLALVLKQVGVHQFTSGHLEEIRKRLDKNQKELTFELLGIKWVINATQVVLQLT